MPKGHEHPLGDYPPEWDNEHTTCEDCEEYTPEDDLFEVNGSYVCESCKENMEEEIEDE